MRSTRRHASPYIRLVPGAERDGAAAAHVANDVAFLRDDPSCVRRASAPSRASRVRVCWPDRNRGQERRPLGRFGISRFSGFTVIELMIVVVIVAILAMIAYPSYEDHLRKGRRSAAQNFLADVATRQQQYLLDARQYAVGAGALGALSVSVPTDVSNFYTVTINPAAPTLPPSFTLVATPLAGSKQAADGALTLDSAGNKTRNGQPGWQ